MTKTLTIIVLALFPFLLLGQKKVDGILVKSLKEIAKEERVQSLVGIEHEGEKVIFFEFEELGKIHHGFEKTSQEDHRVYLSCPVHRFDLDIQHYIQIDTFRKKGNSAILKFHVFGKGKSRKGTARLKMRNGQGWELTKLLLR